MSSPRSSGSSSTSGSCRKLDMVLEACDGEVGHSCGSCMGSSSDEVELEHLWWPLGEKMGVTGEVMSDAEELVV